MKNFPLLALLLSTGVHLSLFAQNLVLNPSFENTSSCPGGISEFYKCTNWDQMNGGAQGCPTPDLYASCSSVIGGSNSPNALLGFQQSRTGNHHAGIILFETAPIINDTTCNNAVLDTYREYIQGQLSAPLSAGMDYCVTFFVNLAGGVKWGTADIGVYFSSSPTVQDCNNPILTVLPQLKYSGPPLLDTISWVKLQWTYNATGGEQYFVIGNFTPNSNVTVANNYCKSWQNTYAYYFIDDVSVTPGACVPCPPISISVASQTNILCAGDSSGAVSIFSSGGQTPYSYNWSPVLSDSSAISGLPAGTYYVNTSDSNLCIGNDTIIITEPPSLNVSIGVISGCGANLGSAKATVTGGVSPYNYLWSNSSTLDSISSLSAGTYFITVTDSNNCKSILSTTITQSALLNLIPSSTLASCGTNNGTASVTASGGNSPYSYSWSNGDTSQTATGLSAGTYDVTVYESGSGNGVFWSEDFTSGGSAWTLNQIGPGTNGTTANSWIINNNNGCGPCGSGGNYLHVTCSGGFICPSPGECFYDLSFASPFGDPTTDKFVSSPDISTVGKTNIVLKFQYQSGGEAGGDYGKVRLSNNGGLTWTDLPTQYAGVSTCTQETINIPASFEGISNFKIAFRWINNSSNSGSGNPFAIDDVQLSAAANNSCLNMTSVSVGSSSGISSSVLANNSSCSVNNGSALVNVSGGASPYSFIWSTGDTTAALTGLGAGNYFVTITDTSGCTLADTAIISISGGPVAMSSTVNVSCFGGNDGTASALVSGGISPFTFLWNNPLSSTSSTATGLPAGNYIVTVTDANNCKDTALAVIVEPTQITANSTITKASCGLADGSITLNVNGGATPYSYNWNNGQSSITASGLVAGNYSATITDANLCTKNIFVSVSNAGAPSITISIINPTCFGNSNGSASVNSSGGSTPYSYSWSNGSTQSQISNLSAQIIFVTVTDAGNCISVASDTVNNPPPLQVSFAGGTNSDSICKGNSISITAFGGISYQWSSGQTGSTISVNPASDTSFIVTATDTNGCSGKDTFDVVVISAAISKVCLGNSIKLTSGNGTAYLWSTGETTQAIFISPGAPSNYYVTVSTSCGTLKDSILAVAGLNAFVSNDTTIERGTTIQISASGGTDYVWSTGELSGSIKVSPVVNTPFMVTITDSSGCSVTAVINVFIDDSQHFLSIPTIFSPNKDGLNDIIKVHGMGIKEYKIIIYDRWGEKVFEFSFTGSSTVGSAEGIWDGTLNGAPLNSAVFIYILDGIFSDGKEFHEKGNITLVR